MALPKLKTALTSAATGLALVATPLGAAHGQQAELQQTSVQMLPDAHGQANGWVVGHPDRMAVAVSIGQSTKVPTETLERVLRQDFAANGVENVRFYYEQGGAGDSVVSYHSDEYVWGPYVLAVARQNVAQAASQFRFNQRLAMN